MSASTDPVKDAITSLTITKTIMSASTDPVKDATTVKAEDKHKAEEGWDVEFWSKRGARRRQTQRLVPPRHHRS
jgi:hypothetical protein